MPVDPLRPRGPSLNALRAFEASARLGGFTAAASELSISPAAVAQHIKTLEEWAGAELFERQSRGVRLTPLGHDVALDFHKAFDQLGEATFSLRRRAKPNHIRIAALPSIAQLWLPSRLAKIRKRFPEITISVTALETPPNLNREPFDLAVFFSPLPLSVDLLPVGEDYIYPVCSPELAQSITSPGDLLNFTHLCDDRWDSDWPDWISTVAPSLRRQSDYGRKQAIYSLYALAIEEAKSGAGIVMARHSLVADLIRSGVLVAPFTQRVPCRSAMAVHVLKDPAAGKTLSALIDMLVASEADHDPSI